MADRYYEMRHARIRASLPLPGKSSPQFLPVCPRPDCGVKNHPEARRCAECGAGLYPSKASIERNRRNHETA